MTTPRAPWAGGRAEQPAGTPALAFEQRLLPPRWLGPLQAVTATAAVAGAVLAVASILQRLGAAAAAAAAVACVAVLLAGVARARAAHRSFVLRVDDAGCAQLRIDGRDHACIPQRWLLADGWVALTVRVIEPGAPMPRTIDLVSGAQPGDDSWRRLRVWLQWLRRGSVPEGEFQAAGAETTRR